MNRNMRARNFGLRSRNINLAAKNALVERGLSYSSIATNTDRFRLFTQWLLDHHQIKDLRWIERSHINAYGNHITEQIKNGALAVATGQNYLSAVNTVLQSARRDNLMDVNPVQFTGERNAVCTSNKALTDSDYEKLSTTFSQSEIGHRQLSCVQQTEAFGLRIKEASLLNSNRALAEAEMYGQVTIKKGTKGGRARVIPITSTKQISVLKAAARLQGKNTAIIPPDLNWKEWKNRFYTAGEKAGFSIFHSGRHAYAQKRYFELTGVLPPVVAGVPHGRRHHLFIADQLSISLADAKFVDRSARLKIARELGHNRIGITNSYLG